MRLNFPAQQVCRGQEPEAPLLLCSPDLPGDGQHQGEDGAEPDLRLDQGAVCFLQDWGPVLAGVYKVTNIGHYQLPCIQ